MKIYALIVGLLLAIVGVFGFVGPALISAKSTEAVGLGVFMLMIAVPILWLIGRSLWTHLEPHWRNYFEN